MSAPRYAVYVVPNAKSALWRFGTNVIGYDSRTGRDFEGFFPDGISADQWRQWTREPRRYGFHATIAAPFELHVGFTEAELLETIDRFAAVQNPIALPSLDVLSIGSFIALCPQGTQAHINRFASDVVTRLNRFRAPLSEFDLLRRNKPNLTERQKAYLHRFGYPYVHDEFRFHLTLTGPLPAEMRDHVRGLLAAAYHAKAAQPLLINTLCVLRQDDRDSSFRVIGELLLEEEFTGLGAWR